MPVYEYECTKCLKIHELQQKMSDPALSKCPDCGSPVDKLISRSSFALKGSGFYTNDYKRAGTSSDSTASPASATTTPPKGCGSGGCGHSH